VTNQQDAGEYAVTWLVDEIEVGASLTRPTGKGRFPAIIMVAGSGPTDRNWNTPLLPGSNGSAALLAQVLAENGFVVLRYDKRASGPQGQANAERLAGRVSMQAHVDELAGGVRLLAARDDVDAGCLFAFSNSEGAIHVLNYQVQEGAKQGALPFVGLILTAPSARPAGALAHAQLAAQLQAVSGGAEQLAAYDRAMADFVAERPLQLEPTLSEGLRNLILTITQPFNLPFARELWITDPLALLAAVTVPVLILIGKKDIQVDWQADGPLFEVLAQTHPNIDVIYAPDANHVLKHEPSDRETLTAAGAAAGYNAEGAQLDREAVEILLRWLQKVA
jgi:pimeloyl-ACP methyl ester carboxylesterase